MTEGVKWKLLGFCIVMGLINIVGLVALVVGVLVSFPVTNLAYLHIYRKLGGAEAKEA